MARPTKIVGKATECAQNYYTHLSEISSLAFSRYRFNDEITWFTLHAVIIMSIRMKLNVLIALLINITFSLNIITS